MLRATWGTWMGVLAVVLIMGCAQETDRPKTVDVTGTVTFNGDPVDGALVTFSPKGTGGHAASGRTDASGNFSLSTFEAGDGAVPGDYAVSVRKTEGGETATAGAGAAGGEVTEEDYDAIYAEMEKKGVDVMGGGEGAKTEPAEDLLPAKYKNPTESGLEAQVTEVGDNHFTFPLEG